MTYSTRILAGDNVAFIGAGDRAYFGRVLSVGSGFGEVTIEHDGTRSYVAYDNCARRP